jgi:hypothetical protein
MLSRKQLEDAARCVYKDNCFSCCMREYRNKSCCADKCVEAAAQTALALADMLKRLEWSSMNDVSRPGYLTNNNCPICMRHRDQGHTEECELAALLKGSEG